MCNWELTFSGRIVNVEERANARGEIRERVVTRDACAIIALRGEGDDDEELLLVKQYRDPVDAYLWELPAGRVDSGETAFDCARRELAEETGYSAKDWEYLGGFYSSPGFASEFIYVFLATDLEMADDPPQGDEADLTMKWVLRNAINVVDAKTLASLYLLHRHRTGGDRGFDQSNSQGL